MPTSSAPHEWLHHLEDEADAAYLYRELAAIERDESRARIYRQLAEVEDRHVAMWRKLLEENGHASPVPQPSRAARLRAWLARRFGSQMLLPLLLEEEGREVKGYLSLYREAPAGAAGPTALKLARESKEHAEQLASISGASSEPWHKTGAGGFLRNVVYGFNDGLTANFGLVAGMIGAQSSLASAEHAVLVAGLAGMVADALSMGSSGYLAAKSEQEVFEHEIAMEQEEIRLMPELERDELALIYQMKGIPETEARALADRVMQDPQRALDEKVREELKIGEATSTPMREAWITGIATAFGAFIPVAPFLFGSGRWPIWTSFAIAMLSHFAVGAARSFFTGRGIIRSGMDMFLVGLGVAVVGYFVGEWIVRLL
ncbi:MAG TPA: VIT1/CCC1 transporter family protein [Gemmatimonadales bacterium]|jgi:VIT1/CCC1 family predicted Fe2+/Mn2+ transporter/rubrerythrin|nr:VIT1/CCC1 transporter family protein [Gemmatimonadales bacterium]